MAKKGIIEEHGLEDKVLALAIAGNDVRRIAAQVSREHNIKLTKSSVDRFLTRHSGTIRDKIQTKQDARIEFTIESVKQLVKETAEEIKEKMLEFQDNPKAMASFLNLKLQAIDRLAKIVGAYPVENKTQVAIGIQLGQRCADCPYKERFTEAELLRIAGVTVVTPGQVTSTEMKGNVVETAQANKRQAQNTRA